MTVSNVDGVLLQFPDTLLGMSFRLGLGQSTALLGRQPGLTVCPCSVGQDQPLRVPWTGIGPNVLVNGLSSRRLSLAGEAGKFSLGTGSFTVLDPRLQVGLSVGIELAHLPNPLAATVGAGDRGVAAHIEAAACGSIGGLNALFSATSVCRCASPLAGRVFKACQEDMRVLGSVWLAST